MNHTLKYRLSSGHIKNASLFKHQNKFAFSMLAAIFFISSCSSGKPSTNEYNRTSSSDSIPKKESGLSNWLESKSPNISSIELCRQVAERLFRLHSTQDDLTRSERSAYIESCLHGSSLDREDYTHADPVKKEYGADEQTTSPTIPTPVHSLDLKRARRADPCGSMQTNPRYVDCRFDLLDRRGQETLNIPNSP